MLRQKIILETEILEKTARETTSTNSKKNKDSYFFTRFYFKTDPSEAKLSEPLCSTKPEILSWSRQR